MAVMTPLNAGEMTERISLERDDISYVSGAEVRTPVTYATIWAAVEDVGGSEALKGQSVASTGYWMFSIRYRTDVKPKDRVIWCGVRMEIVKVHGDARLRTQLGLECHANG